MEHKFYDVVISGAVSTTPVLSLLSGIGQGDTNILRNGNECKMEGWVMRGTIYINASAVATTFRFAIILDTDVISATAPTFTDIFVNTGTETLLNITSMPGRYKVIYDKTFSMSINGTREHKFQASAKMPLHLFWSTGTGTDIRKHALWGVTWSNEATNTPTTTINHRIRFIDN